MLINTEDETLEFYADVAKQQSPATQTDRCIECILSSCIIDADMALTVQFDAHIAQSVETIASELGISAEEYITALVEEAIEDAEECVEYLNEGHHPITYSHDEIMKEFGLR